MDLKKIIRTIPDFPEKGIMFRDITTVLQDPAALRHAVDKITDTVKGLDFDLVLGPESRGFIFGMPMAYNQGKGFVPVICTATLINSPENCGIFAEVIPE